MRYSLFQNEHIRNGVLLRPSSFAAFAISPASEIRVSAAPVLPLLYWPANRSRGVGRLKTAATRDALELAK